MRTYTIYTHLFARVNTGRNFFWYRKKYLSIFTTTFRFWKPFPYLVVWNALTDKYLHILEARGGLNVKRGRTRFSNIFERI